jgi:hypothetical protein
MYDGLHATLTEAIIGAAIEVHRELGPGLFESIYEEALCLELSERGLSFDRQIKLPLYYKGHLVSEYCPDLVVDDADPETRGKVEVSEPQLDGDAAGLLLLEPVGVDAGQGEDQGGLAVIDVPGGAEDDVLHARSLMSGAWYQGPGRIVVCRRRRGPQTLPWCAKAASRLDNRATTSCLENGRVDKNQTSCYCVDAPCLAQ